MRRAAIPVAALLVLIATMSACGTSNLSKAQRSPCSLLSATEASQVLGEQVNAERVGTAFCMYGYPSGPLVTIHVFQATTFATVPGGEHVVINGVSALWFPASASTGTASTSTVPKAIESVPSSTLDFLHAGYFVSIGSQFLPNPENQSERIMAFILRRL